mmetsp:Transcript_60265/g.143628  ORF Transcript_60265/g.143628 Transcript_60265/m.143628 type:complete len:137 (+) Transcript_60265:198-608(+)
MGGAVVRCLDPCCNENRPHDPELVESLSAYHGEPGIEVTKVGHRQVYVAKASSDPNLEQGQQQEGSATGSKDLEEFLFSPDQFMVSEGDTNTIGNIAKVPTLAPTSLIEAAQNAHIETDKPIWVEVSTLPSGPIGL